MKKLLLGLLLTLCTTNLIVGQKSSFIHPDFKSITEYHKVIAVVPFDIDLDQMDEISSAYTPVPGGVGPMTINTLILHTMQSAKKLLPN